MKERLPEYIVNCLIASSGYNKMQVLCHMNTSEKPKNTIEKVENFINKSSNTTPHYLFHLNFHQVIELEYARANKDKSEC